MPCLWWDEAHQPLLCHRQLVTLGIHLWVTSSGVRPAAGAQLLQANTAPWLLSAGGEWRIPKMKGTLAKQDAKKHGRYMLASVTDGNACSFKSNGVTGASAYLLPAPEAATS